MPPKSTKEAGNTSKDAEITAIRALCYLLMSCEQIKADYEKVAPLIGLDVGRNVPRKIHTIVSKYGFEYRRNRIIEKNPSNNDDANDDDDDNDYEDDDDTAATPEAKATASNATASKTPGSRKRKAPTTSKTPARKRAKKMQEIEEADEPDEMVVKRESDSDDEQDTMAGMAITNAA